MTNYYAGIGMTINGVGALSFTTNTTTTAPVAAGTECGITSAGISTTVKKLLSGASSNAAGIDMWSVNMTGCPGYNWTAQSTGNKAKYQSE